MKVKFTEKNLKWYTDLVWKSELIIKSSKKGYKDEISKNIFKYFEVKFSEIRQKSENLHLWRSKHVYFPIETDDFRGQYWKFTFALSKLTDISTGKQQTTQNVIFL